MIGSACFAVGTVPAFVEGVGAIADATTFFVGSLFFTTASLLQLLQSQTPAMAPGGRDAVARALALWAPRPGDHGWLGAATQFAGTLAFNATTFRAIGAAYSTQQTDRLIWTPDFVGSVLFLVASYYGVLAVRGRIRAWTPRDEWWRIAWINMLGSVFFMLSAIGAFVVPATGSEANVQWANGGTFLGAVCFFVGAAWLIPAWRASSGDSPAAH